MRDVWQAAVGERGTDALPANDGRRTGQVDAHGWHLPKVGGRLFSRLYGELGLVGGGLTPRGAEALVRLAGWRPLEQAGELFQGLVGILVRNATVARAP